MKILQSVNSFKKNWLTQPFQLCCEYCAVKTKLTFLFHPAKLRWLSVKGGANVDALVQLLTNWLLKQIHINIIEIKRPDLDAHLVGEESSLVEQRVAPSCTKTNWSNVLCVLGLKESKLKYQVVWTARNIARAEGYSEGQIPLHTSRWYRLRLGKKQTLLTGKLGVKVWIYRGEKFFSS